MACNQFNILLIEEDAVITIDTATAITLTTKCADPPVAVVAAAAESSIVVDSSSTVSSKSGEE